MKRGTKQEGDIVLARARMIEAGETYFVGPQKDYSHGPYAYSRINIHCPTAKKYIFSQNRLGDEVTGITEDDEVTGICE